MLMLFQNLKAYPLWNEVGLLQRLKHAVLQLGPIKPLFRLSMKGHGHFACHICKVGRGVPGRKKLVPIG
jgi:hypothetical protein